MNITIKNWEKYNPKRDQKSYSWFRFDNDFPFDQKMFELTIEEKYLYIFILCLASKRNMSTINSIPAYISSMTNISLKNVINGIKHLELLDIISTTPALHQHYTSTTPTNETNETNERDERLKKSSLSNMNDILPLKNAKDNSEVWFSYAKAYESKYKTIPTRNAKTNSICKRLVESVGKDKAINIVNHYLTINDSWYLKNYHKIEFCLNDYQKILTSYETGLTITSTYANNLDKKQSSYDAIDRGLARADEIIKRERESKK